MRFGRETGEIRLRTVLEFAFIFVLAYLAVQVAPVVILRMNFLNELQVAANSPVGDSAVDIRRKVLETAEGYGITLLSEQLSVERDRAQKRTVIDATYQLYINFGPTQLTYAWNIHDRVEGLLF
jgi:hypothetical protein